MMETLGSGELVANMEEERAHDLYVHSAIGFLSAVKYVPESRINPFPITDNDKAYLAKALATICQRILIEGNYGPPDLGYFADALVGALAVCGDYALPVIAKFYEGPFTSRSTYFEFRALEAVGTQQAIERFAEYLAPGVHDGKRIAAVRALGNINKRTGKLDPALQSEIFDVISAYLQRAEHERIYEAAAAVGDPRLIPLLESISSTGDDMASSSAKSAIHQIRWATDSEYRERSDLQQEIEYNTQMAEQYQNAIAAGKDVESNSARLAQVQQKIEEVRAKLESLGTQQ